ncbi:MAG: PA14 domain-containing protein, partial [Verrucomicrobiota bacterium]|nr:PA14 domain-containing protein [Verrucomicrobiota bacterium]
MILFSVGNVQAASVPGLRGSYYNGKNLEVFSTLRIDETVDFNWSGGSPSSTVNPDQFSVEWIGEIYIPQSGVYTFFTTTDDGSVLTVAGNILINDWIDHGAVTRSATVSLVGGQWVPIRLKFYENGGAASAKLEWLGPSIIRQIIPKGHLRVPVGTLETGLAAPANFRGIRLGIGLVTLGWSATPGAKAYAIYRNGFLVGVTGESTYTDRGLSASTSYSYEVKACDDLLNTGFGSQALTLTTLPTQMEGTGLKGEYFDELNFTVFKGVRLENVNFNWGNASPMPSIGADTFSIRWTGELTAPATRDYTLSITSDDGVRLWIDGKLLIDRWVNQGSTTMTTVVSLEAGRKYEVKLEYFENGGGANVLMEWSGQGLSRQEIPRSALNGLLDIGEDQQAPTAPQNLHSLTRTETSITLGWTASPDADVAGYKITRGGVYAGTTSDAVFRVGGLSGGSSHVFAIKAFDRSLNESSALTGNMSTLTVRPPGTGKGLRAEYFDDRSLSELVAVQVEGPVNFNWGNGAPLSGMGVDTFSVRWAGQVEALYTEPYTLYMTSDDGIRMWVDGKLVIDRWVDQGATTTTAQVTFESGRKYEIVIEYYENGGGASAKLEWSSPSQTRQVIPPQNLYTLEDSRDTQPPLPPLNLKLSEKSESAVTLKWEVPSNPADVYGYVIYRNGEVVGMVSGVQKLEFRDRGLTPLTLYTYSVRSYDGVLNESAGSPPVSVMTTGVTGGGTGAGLWAWYYDNTDLTGLMLQRLDPKVQFNWGNGSPHPSIGVDTFSARWRGQVEAKYSEEYTFYISSDDGVRLWVNGQLIVDNWVNQGTTEKQGKITLVAGRKYDIKLEYFENTGGANVTLSWSSPGQVKEIIPTGFLYPVAVDSDGDGMPDTWELANGLNPSSPLDAATDSDGDGVVNFNEYLLSLDPNDYFNGSLSSLLVISGNNQSASTNTFVAAPL